MTHRETKSNDRMKALADKDLVGIVKSGSLSSAAARYELGIRNRLNLLKEGK